MTSLCPQKPSLTSFPSVNSPGPGDLEQRGNRENRDGMEREPGIFTEDNEGNEGVTGAGDFYRR